VVREIEPSRYGIKESGDSFNLTGIIHVGKSSDPSIAREKASIEKIIAHLKSSYAGRIGFEFTHIPSGPERRWFATLIESVEKKRYLESERKHFFSLLTKSEVYNA
jgi:probable 2-oxoglutarate dehydrogenase E1 component DHKTD1